MKISVIIPVCNTENNISNAVKSALHFEEVHEVILIEDGSYDDSLLVCQELAGKYEKVKLFQYNDKKNHGTGVSKNLGIEEAKGDFIAFLNANDYYLPNRFEAEKKLFQNPKIDGVYGASGIHYYSEKAKEQYYHIYEDRLTTIYEKCPPQAVFPGQMNFGNLFGSFSINALTVRKDRLLEKMPVLFKPLYFYVDREFLLRLSYYLDLYSGILNKPVAMRGIVENTTNLIIPKRISYTSKVLLWKELHDWVEKEDSLPQEMKIHTRRMYNSFRIANAPFLKKWAMILKYIFLDYPCVHSDVYNVNFIDSL